MAYTVQPMSDKAIVEQRTAYTALLQNLGKVSFDEIQKALDARESVEPEPGLTPEVVKTLRDKIQAQKRN